MVIEFVHSLDLGWGGAMLGPGLPQAGSSRPVSHLRTPSLSPASLLRPDRGGGASRLHCPVAGRGRGINATKQMLLLQSRAQRPGFFLWAAKPRPLPCACSWITVLVLGPLHLTSWNLINLHFITCLIPRLM